MQLRENRENAAGSFVSIDGRMALLHKMSVWSAAICFLSFVILPGTLAAQSNERLPVPVRVLNNAWGAYEEGNDADAIANAQKVIDEFEPDARQTQKELLETNSPLPAVGRIDAGEMDRIFQFGPLNDVAAAWYIKGRALARMGRNEEALEALGHAAAYPYARVYDRDWGGFWSPANSANAWITNLRSQQQPMPAAPPQ